MNKIKGVLKAKIAFNNTQAVNNNINNNNNNNNNNDGGQVNTNEKEGEQENENIIECMNVLNKQEEAEQFVFSLLEEIIWNAETLLFEKYIEKQIIPFTLNFLENKIMEIIDWNFFKYDNGIINKDEWFPDNELEPIINDSWARGAIPVKHIPKKSINENTSQTSLALKLQTSSLSINETKKNPSKKSILSKTKNKKLKKDIDNNPVQISNKSILTKKENVTKVSETNQVKKIKKIKTITSSSIQHKKIDKALNIKEKQIPYMNKLKNKPTISDILNNKQSTIQIQMNKDGWKIDNIYNYTGSLISSIKTSPDKSFDQKVKAHIIEPIKSKQKFNDKKLFQHINDKKNDDEETINLSALHNNDLNNDIEKLQNDINNLNNFIKQKQSISSEVKRTLHNKSVTNSQRSLHSPKIKKNIKNNKLDPLLNYNKKDINYNYEKYIEDNSLEIPPLMNSINIAPGVKLYEGNSYKSGPSLYPNNLEENGDPEVLLLKKGKQSNISNKEPQLNNELLKEIILKTNPTLKSN